MTVALPKSIPFVVEAIIQEEGNPLPKERSHETTIDVGLVPHSSSPLSLHDVSGGSIRPVVHALILCAGVAEWAFCGSAVRRILEVLSQAQYSFERSLGKMTLAKQLLVRSAKRRIEFV